MYDLVEATLYMCEYFFDSIAEYIIPGKDSNPLSVQIIVKNILAFFLEFLRCNGRTMATYL